MLVAASSPLTKIIPGLMIWTIVFFLIVFFVLKRYAFGAIQKLIDERREQVRRSLEEADNAREEARKLLEEHRQLIGQARSQAEEILGEARKTRESMELRMVLRNPQLESSAKAKILADLAGDEDPLFKNFLMLVAEKGRAGEIEEIAKEFERLIAREERRLTVELTTARELTDAEAKDIVAQIEKAAGRKVEATRSVDPGLVGGIVLKAGSYRVDASVRGRLERLRHELVRR